MNNQRRTRSWLGAGLLLLSFLIYGLQIAIFRDARNTFFYLLQDMAFVPLQVVAVTLILEQVLAARERQELMRQLNVVISAFFSEAGTELLAGLVNHLRDKQAFREVMEIADDWTEQHFRRAARLVTELSYAIDDSVCDLAFLSGLLRSKKAFLLSLFGNRNLLEHETFTDVLWTVFHLSEELESRPSVDSLPAHDLEHLAGDMKRACQALTSEWLYYMNHLRQEYPYLYSLARRKSPFAEQRSAIIS